MEFYVVKSIKKTITENRYKILFLPLAFLLSVLIERFVYPQRTWIEILIDTSVFFVFLFLLFEVYLRIKRKAE